jgi:hypothetical protein
MGMVWTKYGQGMVRGQAGYGQRSRRCRVGVG